jgi:PAS domain S-box-containing protein
MISCADNLKASILIVDDQEANVVLLEQMLRDAGYVGISSTRDPHAVCALHRQNHYDLILLDLQMPGMDGFQVMEGLKEIEIDGYLPVLVITAQPGHKLRALKAGAKDFVSKPFDLGEVLARVYNMVEVRLLHRETQRLYDQVLAEQKVSQQLLLIFRSGPDAVSINALADGRIIDANEEHCKFVGYSREEIVGRSDADLKLWANPDDRKPVTQRLLEEGAMRGFESKLRRRSGEVRDVLASFELIELAGEHEPVMISMFTDVTERKQRALQHTAELVAANKELEAFSYSVSHDLRAPLRAIDGFSQTVLENYGAQLPEEGQRALRIIREGAQKMGMLIDDLLTFSRLSRAPLKKQEVHTGKLVRSVVTDLGPQKGRQIDLRVGDLPACSGDPALLRQVWINLISNAFKYTRQREPATVEIGCREEKGVQVYYVRDNGTGFDMRYADKLFGVFQRLHRAEDYEGTGVGLAIVQRIVTRHGGRVWAEAAVNRGATFYFTLEGGTGS